MAGKEEIEKILQERDKLLEEVGRRSQEIKALNMRTVEILNERVKMIEELQQHNSELEILLAVAKSAAQLQEPEKMLQVALDKALEYLGLERGFAALLGEGEGKFCSVCHRGFPPHMAQQLEQSRSDQGLIGAALHSGQPIVVEDIGISTTAGLQVTPELAPHSLCIAVLKGREKVLGVISVSSRRQRPFTGRERELLSAIASQIGTALDSARLFQQVRQGAQRIEVVSSITKSIAASLKLTEVYETFAQEMRKLIDFDRFSMPVRDGDWIYVPMVSRGVDPERRAGERMPLKGSTLEWLIEHKESVVQGDISQERLSTADELHIKQGLRSAIRVPIIHKGEVLGSLNLFSARPNAFGEREQEILEGVAGEIAVAIRNDLLFEELTRRSSELEEAYRRLEEHSAALKESLREQERAYLLVAETLVHLLETRQPFMKGHSERVARFARLISRQMSLSQSDERRLELAARLHDIGMLATPENLWFKEMGLSPAERAQLETHPTAIAEVLMVVPFLRDALPLVRAHHERYDGKGYPDGLRGEGIPLGARIIAVADAYDAITSERPYRSARSSEEALEILKKGAGTEWDPRVVEVLIQALGSGSYKSSD